MCNKNMRILIPLMSQLEGVSSAVDALDKRSVFRMDGYLKLYGYIILTQIAYVICSYIIQWVKWMLTLGVEIAPWLALPV